MEQRRIFVGDLHGCHDELCDLLEDFKFNPKQDKLYSVGDIIGKGPKVEELLKALKSWNAGIVRGNHDQALLNYWNVSEVDRSVKQNHYINSLGEEKEKWIQYIESWPYFMDLDDVLLVHGGFAPGIAPEKTTPRIMMNLRTWDGIGLDLKSESNPAWYDLVQLDKKVVFGHWAKRGLIDKPMFKGLDTGCVYGRRLTGYCPEDDQFYSVPSYKEYFPIDESS